MLRSILAIALLVAACAGPGATTAPTSPRASSPQSSPSAAAVSAAPASAAPTAAPASPAASAATGETVSLSDEGYFVGPNGLSLYTFDNDEHGTSNCEGECLVNWPALMVESEDDIVVGDGVDAAQFSAIERSDGSLQVAFNDMPLYYFIGDAAPGDVNGDGLNDVWHLARDTAHAEPDSTQNPDDYF
jgi:predicted lipoprotein with Yx(FWY)xxD motif